MTVDFAAKQIFSGDLENAPYNISDMFRDLVEGLMSFPINLPGTAHHKCLQVLKNLNFISVILTKRPVYQHFFTKHISLYVYLNMYSFRTVLVVHSLSHVLYEKL